MRSLFYLFWQTLLLRERLWVFPDFPSHCLLLPCLYALLCIGFNAGLSLKSQELTAIFLAVRLYCSFVMEFDIHTILDSATLATTLWVIYMIRFKLRSTYMEEKDNFAIYYVVSFHAFICLYCPLDPWCTDQFCWSIFV